MSARCVMESFRKRLLPFVEKERIFPLETHWSRKDLHPDVASRLLACFGPRTWLWNSPVGSVMQIWQEYKAVYPLTYSVGGFVLYLFQCHRYLFRDKLHVEGAESLTETLWRTLYVAGFVEHEKPAADM